MYRSASILLLSSCLAISLAGCGGGGGGGTGGGGQQTGGGGGTGTTGAGTRSACGTAAKSHRVISYVSDRALDGSDNLGASSNLWTINSDCSGNASLTTLTVPYVDRFHTAWSPDGRKLLYDSNRALDGSDVEISGCLLGGHSLAGNTWAINADGSGNLPLTSIHCGDLSETTWSPDGKKIAFISSANLDGSDPSNFVAFDNNSANIWVMNADGSGAMPVTQVSRPEDGSTQLPPFGNSVTPMWSPDGTKIVYSSIRALDGSNANTPFLNSNIWVVNADGTGSTPLTHLASLPPGSISTGPNRCYSPHWSPDGTRIAMVCVLSPDGNEANPAGTNIWVMNADGSGATALSKFLHALADEPYSVHGNFGVSANTQIWSPDGSKIAFLSQGSLDGSDSGGSQVSFNLWIMNADGSGGTHLTNINSTFAPPPPPPPPFPSPPPCPTCLTGVTDFDWSPDGSQLAFVSDMNVNGSLQPPHFANIWVVNTDGSQLTVLTNLVKSEAELPRWKL